MEIFGKRKCCLCADPDMETGYTLSAILFHHCEERKRRMSYLRYFPRVYDGYADFNSFLINQHTGNGMFYYDLEDVRQRKTGTFIRAEKKGIN